MIPLRELGAERVARLWGEYAGAKYRIGPDLVEQNLFDHSLFHDGASFGDDDGFVAVKRSAATLYNGPDPRTAHLSLLAGKPDAPLQRAIEILRHEGVETLVVGTDSGHFLPGAPTDVEGLDAWLESRGFEAGGLAFDLERDLGGYRSPEAPPADYRVLEADDEASLVRFLDREFPGRWKFDVLRKVEAEGIGTVFGLFLAGACEGFALLQRDGCRLPIGGATWKADLGPDWASLGPIGISRSVRGRGLGNALLGKALDRLAHEGSRQTIIDWTGLVDFYGAHGFTVTRTYRSYRLTLREDRPPSA